MKVFAALFIFIITFSSCESQTKKAEKASSHIVVGGPCEGCEAIFEYGNQPLSPVDTLPDFEKTEPKLKLTGTVFENDGKTPAENVIVYIYHTNRKGIYATNGNEIGWAKRHGYIRGWIKTDKTGKYTFFTSRPAAYPNAKEPEHIHLTVKEPNKNEYYIDDVIFDDDPFLTQKHRERLTDRGGSGIVKPILNGGILCLNRNIILGLNIPDYD
ncbi:intradiol ring-cleavage dioxygenase [Aequorivita sp. SDUM287046]|uniref:Intradiol ring-cleavage dioxygenase n=1 Tax=Aequorivita aurantiaca TaxID=3053356 RepID=A0ABT8DHP9_9FLAO|nr:intradiol ring-cleavage dioxygenase [Aequorivita aurantiaca]MDN3724935.1 intradiol ring-cleavage dioxygenase [Aequorivita aurantiaca]